MSNESAQSIPANPMHHELSVDNIKCGGCARSISESLGQINGVHSVEVNVDAGTVCFVGPESSVAEAANRLSGMGYPLTGSVAGLRSAAATAMSYASCAIGRIEEMKDGVEARLHSK
ncbi:MAG: heavy metal-associated domain-containing protein [Deltaproteobacteria bacterium]|nr:heavy metal-associated domain-containing protein [Deltaproteobacteria bacterium]